MPEPWATRPLAPERPPLKVILAPAPVWKIGAAPELSLERVIGSEEDQLALAAMVGAVLALAEPMTMVSAVLEGPPETIPPDPMVVVPPRSWNSSMPPVC